MTTIEIFKMLIKKLDNGEETLNTIVLKWLYQHQGEIMTCLEGKQFFMNLKMNDIENDFKN